MQNVPNHQSFCVSPYFLVDMAPFLIHNSYFNHNHLQKLQCPWYTFQFWTWGYFILSSITIKSFHCKTQVVVKLHKSGLHCLNEFWNLEHGSRKIRLAESQEARKIEKQFLATLRCCFIHFQLILLHIVHWCPIQCLFRSCTQCFQNSFLACCDPELVFAFMWIIMRRLGASDLVTRMFA